MNKSTVKLFVLISAITAVLYTQAQVTIGSKDAPTKGSILQLKENDDGDVNASKGLLLPRVKINNLTPSTPSELSGSIGGTDEWDLNIHTGLLVYNIAENNLCTPQPILKGPYIWNGTEWQCIRAAYDTDYYIDTRAQVHGTQIYPYRSFGAAGTWMLENIRYLPTDGSFTFSQPGESAFQHSKLKRYFYPQVNQGKETDFGKISTWDTKQGILYFFAAATNGELDNVGGDRGNNDTDHIVNRVQGICPDGWHIPTDYEWSMLEEEIAKHPGKYSTVTTPTLWRDRLPGSGSIGTNDDYEAQYARPNNSGGPGHATAMKTRCPIPGSKEQISGESLIPEMGGFNVLLIGRGEGGQALYYGSTCYFWAASPHGGLNAWIRGFSDKTKSVDRGATVRTYLCSVRCKRDN